MFNWVLDKLGLCRKSHIDYKWWYTFEKEQSWELIREIRKLRARVDDLSDKIYIRRAMTPPFDQEKFFIQKKCQRLNRILKNPGDRSFEDFERLVRNTPGVELHISISKREP